jgi:hypothetical protein
MTKEKLTKEIRVMIQPSLYNNFKKKCEEEYTTISEKIRQFISSFVKNKNE